MKLRRMRGVYCVEANESVTMVIEKATPATVIIELAIAVSMPRAPSALAPSNGRHPSVSS